MAAGGDSVSPFTHDPRYLIGPRDVLHPSSIIMYILAWFAFSVYHRPYLPEFLPSYQAFTAVMPWHWWGWAAFIGAGLLFGIQPGSPWRLIAHAWAGIFFFAAAGAFTASAGLTSAGGVYSILGYASVVLFARSAVYLAQRTAWWSNLVQNPPRWVCWLAEWSESRGRR